MLVVSDTSPLRALHHLERVHVLSILYGQILIPPAVAEELAAGSASSPVVDLSRYPTIQIRRPESVDPRLRNDEDLDAGEIEAIALAVQLKAHRLLIDERAGRERAEALGVPTVGVLGILLEAKQRGVVPRVAPLIDRLRNEIRFFVADDLYRDVLRRASE